MFFVLYHGRHYLNGFFYNQSFQINGIHKANYTSVPGSHSRQEYDAVYRHVKIKATWDQAPQTVQKVVFSLTGTPTYHSSLFKSHLNYQIPTANSANHKALATGW